MDVLVDVTGQYSGEYTTQYILTSRIETIGGRPYNVKYGKIVIAFCTITKSATERVGAPLLFQDKLSPVAGYNGIRHLSLRGSVAFISGLPSYKGSPDCWTESTAAPVYPFGCTIDREISFDSGNSMRLFTCDYGKVDKWQLWAVIMTYRIPGREGRYSINVYGFDTKTGYGMIRSAYGETAGLRDSTSDEDLYHKAFMLCPLALSNLSDNSRLWIKSTSPQLTCRVSPTIGHLPTDPSQWFAPDAFKVNWNAMAADAYEDLGFWEGNGIAYFSDLRKMKQSVLGTLASLNSLTSKTYKACSQIYLSFHYGWSLFASDTKELLALFDGYYSRRKCQSALYDQVAGSYRQARYQCYYDPYGQVTSLLTQLVDMLDLEPELSNLWDLVPFSFVADWFTNVGDILESLDNYFSLIQLHEVIAAGTSLLLTKPITLTLPAGTQMVTYQQPECRYYTRSYSRVPIGPEYHLSFSNPLTQLSHHWKEATALVVSRM